MHKMRKLSTAFRRLHRRIQGHGHFEEDVGLCTPHGWRGRHRGLRFPDETEVQVDCVSWFCNCSSCLLRTLWLLLLNLVNFVILICSFLESCAIFTNDSIWNDTVFAASMQQTRTVALDLHVSSIIQSRTRTAGPERIVQDCGCISSPRGTSLSGSRYSTTTMRMTALSWAPVVTIFSAGSVLSKAGERQLAHSLLLWQILNLDFSWVFKNFFQW